MSSAQDGNSTSRFRRALDRSITRRVRAAHNGKSTRMRSVQDGNRTRRFRRARDHSITRRVRAALASVCAAAVVVAAGGAHAAGQQMGDHRLLVGYYVPYDSTSWVSLQAHADQLDIVAAQWVTIDGCCNL